jgi:hypothetical protein
VWRGGRIPGLLEFLAGKAIRRRVRNDERGLGIRIGESGETDDEDLKSDICRAGDFCLHDVG